MNGILKRKKQRVCSMFKIFSTYICWINKIMEHLEVSGAVRPLKWSLGVKWLISFYIKKNFFFGNVVSFLLRLVWRKYLITNNGLNRITLLLYRKRGRFVKFCVFKIKMTWWQMWSKCKRKAVPLQAWSDPEGCRKLRFPDFMTMAQDGCKVVSLTHRPPFPPRKYTWYSFLLEAESTPGP